MSKIIDFSKFTGLGNDFIVIDLRNSNFEFLQKEINQNAVIRICDRKFGIGADGIILILPPVENNNHLKMRIFNSDGTEAEMCGNGIRCLLSFDNHLGNIYPDNKIKVETKSGLCNSSILKDGQIKVDMGKPILNSLLIPTTIEDFKNGLPSTNINIDNITLKVNAVGMGNPHLIVYYHDFENIPLERWGKSLEANSYFPNKTNVHFVNIINRNKIEVKVWERGCGPTLACGTGACACVASTYLNGYTQNSVEVSLPGGLLHIDWPDKNKAIFMTGPALSVYNGSFNLNSFY